MPNLYYKPGKYACKVTGQGFSEAKTSKNMQFVLRVLVLGPVDPNDPGSYLTGTAQYERTIYRALTDKTIEYFIEDLKSLGVAVTSFRDLDPSTPGFVDLKNTDVDCTCEHDTGVDGVMREKWSIARSGSELKLDPLPPQKARDLDNLFGKQLKASLNKRAPQTAAVMAQGVTDDDIPI